MKIVNVFVLATLIGCSTVREYRTARAAEYHMVTKNLCIENETEVHLAQLLYLEMLRPGHK